MRCNESGIVYNTHRLFSIAVAVDAVIVGCIVVVIFDYVVVVAVIMCT